MSDLSCKMNKPANVIFAAAVADGHGRAAGLAIDRENAKFFSDERSPRLASQRRESTLSEYPSPSRDKRAHGIPGDEADQ